MSALDSNLEMAQRHGAGEWRAQMPRDWPGAKNSRCVHAAGIDWHVQQQGNSGPVLLLLHGAGASTHSWADLMPMAAREFQVFAIDLPGHGFTQPFQAGAYTIQRTARAVSSLLEALGVSPTVIVGHSAGAAIAMQMSIDGNLPATAVRQIVAINPALLPFSGLAGIAFPALAKIAAGSGLLAGLIASRASDEAQVRRLIAGTGSRIPEAGIRRYQFLMRRAPHVSAVLSMMAGWQLDHLVPALHQTDPHIHCIIGDLDRAVPPARTKAVAKQLSQTVITQFAELGHLAHEESAQQVFDALIARLPDAIRPGG